MTPKRKERLRRKLQESRLRLLTRLPRFADPLLTMRYYAVQAIDRMSTDGTSIYFDPDWLQKAEPFSLDFMMSHQLMHIYLGHIHRPALYRGPRFHLACDVIANSELRKLGWEMEQMPGVGIIYHKTFYPVREGAGLLPEEAFAQIPMDPATLTPGARKRYSIDSDAYWEHGVRSSGEEILILSPDDPDPEALAVAKPPASRSEAKCEGHREQIALGEDVSWSKADKQAKKASEQGADQEDGDPEEDEEELFSTIDHIIEAGKWLEARKAAPEPVVQPAKMASDWDAATKEKLRSVRAERSYSQQKAERSTGKDRIWKKADRTCMDWRKLLDSFLQEEICDYSFLPPNRRFQDSDFFLPDFNDKMIQPLKVLFMVDTSGSVDDDLLSIAYTEITSAIEQFHGGLTGLLGFFDTQVYPPRPFASVRDVRGIMPHGGGGTDLHCVFRSCRKYFGDDRLASLVILTDGKADLPEEAEAAGIPTFWLLTDETVLPTWGLCAYLPR